jgi:hypothetical protein
VLTETSQWYSRRVDNLDLSRRRNRNQIHLRMRKENVRTFLAVLSRSESGGLGLLRCSPRCRSESNSWVSKVNEQDVGNLCSLVKKH